MEIKSQQGCWGLRRPTGQAWGRRRSQAGRCSVCLREALQALQQGQGWGGEQKVHTQAPEGRHGPELVQERGLCQGPHESRADGISCIHLAMGSSEGVRQR